MKTLKLTAQDFEPNYPCNYIGKEAVANFDGHIEIEGGISWVKFTRLAATGHIWAGAGTGIKAGTSIEAGTGIKAGEGIEAGLSITCKLVLKFNYRLFAGVAVWRDMGDEEKKITCGKLEGGTVCYGDVEELGLPEPEPTPEQPKLTELTLDEIADKFGVPVEELRIKE